MPSSGSCGPPATRWGPPRLGGSPARRCSSRSRRCRSRCDSASRPTPARVGRDGRAGVAPFYSRSLSVTREELTARRRPASSLGRCRRCRGCRGPPVAARTRRCEALLGADLRPAVLHEHRPRRPDGVTTSEEHPMGTVTVGHENEHADRAVLRRSRQRRPIVLLRAGVRRSVVGTPTPRPAGRRPSRHQLRPRGSAGRASPPSGYDFDTLTADVDAVMPALDIATPRSSASHWAPANSRGVGRSGRTAARLRLHREPHTHLREERGPSHGVDQAGVDRRAGGDPRRPEAWLTGISGTLLNLDDYQGERVSEDTVRRCGKPARRRRRGQRGRACKMARGLQGRRQAVDVPTLIIHGTADRILPIDGQGRPCPTPCRAGGTSRSTAAPIWCASRTPWRSSVRCCGFLREAAAASS